MTMEPIGDVVRSIRRLEAELMNLKRRMARSTDGAGNIIPSAIGGPAGSIDHGQLAGLGDIDHDAAAISFTPTTAGDWDGGTDPGDLNDAVDQLAERVFDLEASPPSSDFVSYIPLGDASPGGDTDGHVTLFSAEIVVKVTAGVASFFFEAILKTDDGSFPVYARLFDVTAAAVVSGSTVTTSSLTPVRVRSAAITLASLDHEYRAEKGG